VDALALTRGMTFSAIRIIDWRRVHDPSILASIEQCAERPDFFLKSQQLIRHAFRRAMNDQLVADRFSVTSSSG
jgi:hypothetical protein